MTRVVYDEKNLKMDIRGHAKAGDYGSDLVCAAASILMHTLEAALEDRGEELMPAVRKCPGEAMILCRPEAEHEQRCRDIMRTVFIGYELLANRWPENVETQANIADWREI